MSAATAVIHFAVAGSHFHEYWAWWGALSAAQPACPAGSRNRVTPPMMHVWFVPIPGGPAAVDASDAQVVHAAEQVAAPANGTA